MSFTVTEKEQLAVFPYEVDAVYLSVLIPLLKFTLVIFPEAEEITFAPLEDQVTVSAVQDPLGTRSRFPVPLFQTHTPGLVVLTWFPGHEITGHTDGVTVADADAVQPLELVAVTEKVPPEVTVIACVVAEVDHRYVCEPGKTVNPFSDPRQGSKGPEGVMLTEFAGNTNAVA